MIVAHSKLGNTDMRFAQNKPTRKQYKKDLETMMYIDVASKYGVSRVTELKWRKEYGCYKTRGGK